MIKGLSHIVITSNDVNNITEFFSEAFGISPHFANEDFSDFLFGDETRVAFFRPVGKAADFFECLDNPAQVSYGVSVENVDEFYEKLMRLKDKWSFDVSGPPKDHPWGKRSFLLIDPDRNRWEIT